MLGEINDTSESKRVANLQVGETVLIHAGAGGVGSLAKPLLWRIAIQLAKAMGAYVFTTCSAENFDFVSLIQFCLGVTSFKLINV
jgi:NADPH:quinone reductase-like Zn-dependent oxidoreductase